MVERNCSIEVYCHVVVLGLLEETLLIGLSWGAREVGFFVHRHAACASTSGSVDDPFTDSHIDDATSWGRRHRQATGQDWVITTP